MVVREVQQGAKLQPNCVYVIPPNTLMSILDGRLHLEPRSDKRGAPRPIDHFFRSLAEDRKASAIGVLLSGADSDGAIGLQAIRAEGGFAIVQTENSAKYPDMPRNAVAAGPVDLILPPEEIGAALGTILRHPTSAGGAAGTHAEGQDADEGQLGRILELLRTVADADFRGYKRPTVLRRIARRMMLRPHATWETYLSDLDSDRSELQALHEDILIGVTEFFRDPESFAALQRDILPVIAHERPRDVPLRVWVPGCSTGQEAYSVAMCLMELAAAYPAPLPIQIFGTDLSDRAIATARTGIFPEAQVSTLSPERQARFFMRTAEGYRISKLVREMCVFARQNLLADPPFSRLDLISCRNVLIYLDPQLQRRAIATFHFALRPEGYLWVGRSDGVRELSDLFAVVDKQHKLFRKNNGQTATLPALGVMRSIRSIGSDSLAATASDESRDLDLQRAAERVVLAEYGPAWVVVNDKLEIVHSGGDTTRFLQLPPGRATLSLLKMVRDGLRAELRRLLTRAANEHGSVRATVADEARQGNVSRLELAVRRLAGQKGVPTGFLVLFLAADTVDSAEENPSDACHTPKSPDVDMLLRELTCTRQRLEAIIDERNVANQDLTTANEEIQATNEELQSTNEELETSKEELQSANEELNTMNEELRRQNQALNRLTDDLENLLSSTTIPILMLDRDLRIRRMTPVAERMLNVRSSDVGRPLAEIRMRLRSEDLETFVRKVLGTLIPEELELQDREGCWYSLRIRAYRTADNQVDGAVLSFIDIDGLRRAELAASAGREFAESVVASLRTPVLVLRTDGRVKMSNQAFLKIYGVQRTDVDEQLLFQIAGGQLNVPDLQNALARLTIDHTLIESLEFDQEFTSQGKRTLSITARSIAVAGEAQILVALEDITDYRTAQRILVEEQKRLKRRVEVSTAELERTAGSLRTESVSRTQAESALHETEAALLRSREELRALAASLLHTQDEERRRVSRELHDDLSQKIAKLQFDVEMLEQQLPSGLKTFKDRLLTLRDEVGDLSNDVRKIAYQLHPSTLDHLALSVAFRSFTRDFSEREGLDIKFTACKVPKRVPPVIASSLYRVLQEALRNVAKHAGKVAVKVALTGGSKELRLTVQDYGRGFEITAVQGRGGLGLISMQERVRLVHGEFSLTARPGSGVVVAVRVPLT